MNIRRLLLPLVTLFLGSSQYLAAADAPAVPTKPGYNVVLDVAFNEEGVGEEAKIIESDDPTGDLILNTIAMHLAADVKQPKKMKDGKPVKFTVRVPFNFPVEGDEGAAANNAPRPSLHGEQVMPIFPENLVNKEENGGAILELSIGSYGNVQNVKVMRASHQEYAAAAVAAVKTWIFNPAQKDGVNVETRWRVAIAFSANGKEIDWKWRLAPRPSLGGYTVVRPKLPLAAPAEPAPVVAPSGATLTLPVK